MEGDYQYAAGGILPHRRAVKWTATIERSAMSDALKASTGSIGTLSNVTGYQAEIDALVGSVDGPVLVSTDATVEDPVTFALEKHLEDFLVGNWSHTALGKAYDIFKDEGAVAGQQYPTDTGPIDILAVSKDKKELLVVELKRGRASDAVVGQILRYMGFVSEVLTEPDQTVRGVIIALEDDPRLRRALSMVPSVSFYRYKVHFDLIPA